MPSVHVLKPEKWQVSRGWNTSSEPVLILTVSATLSDPNPTHYEVPLDLAALLCDQLAHWAARARTEALRGSRPPADD